MELEDEDAMEVVDSPCSDTFSSGAKVQLLEPYTSLLRSSMLESDVSVSCSTFCKVSVFLIFTPVVGVVLDVYCHWRRRRFLFALVVFSTPLDDKE